MGLMRIGSRIVGEGRSPLMIAEEGQANQGDLEVAKKVTRLAAASGADGIEFQFFLADDMYVRADPGHAIYKSRELSASEIREIIAYAKECGLLCQIAGLSPSIIELCADADADVFCVNATDLNNPQIIDAVAATGKPFWLATLMGTIEEIDWAVDYALGRCRSDIGLLHGQHVMSSEKTRGVPPELLQLDCIELFKHRYGLATGFVDHTATKFMPALAAAKGAALITKHIAPDADWRGPDWVVCLDPEEWKEAREMLRYAFLANGASKEISQMEFKDRSVHRRSIHTRHALPAEHRLAAADLVALRPGKGGLDPKGIPDLLGKRLRNALPEQHQIQSSDLVQD
ncbi:SpsE Sialic acid synthase [Oxalobacteraceae bacterium]